MTQSQKPGKFQSLLTAFRLYWQMNSEGKKVIRKRMLEGSKSPEEWLRFMDQVAKFDFYADSVRPFIGTASIVVFAITVFVSIFLLSFTADSGAHFFVRSFIYPDAVIVGLCGLGLMIYFYLKSKDVQNHVRLFLVPLIQVLKEEIKGSELLYIKSDLRKKDRKDNEIKRTKNYKISPLAKLVRLIPLSLVAIIYYAIISNNEITFVFIFVGVFVSIFAIVFISFSGKYPKILTTWHQHPWLEIKTRLSDNTLFHVFIRDDITRYQITRKKRGSSGKTKIKTKTKYKIRSNVFLHLGLPNQRYEVGKVNALRRDGSGVKMKHHEGAKREVIKVNYRLKSKDINEVPGFEKFLTLVAKAYQQAEPVQKKS